MQSSRGQFVLISFLMFGLMLLGLFVVAYRMEQITLYTGPTLGEAFVDGLQQAVATGKTAIEYLIAAGRAVIEYMIDKGMHIR